jgi:hypothetical protein
LNTKAAKNAKKDELNRFGSGGDFRLVCGGQMRDIWAAGPKGAHIALRGLLRQQENKP